MNKRQRANQIPDIAGEMFNRLGYEVIDVTNYEEDEMENKVKEGQIIKSSEYKGVCPNCGGKDIVLAIEPEGGGDEIVEIPNCESCGCQWVKHFKLAFITIDVFNPIESAI